MLNFFYDHWRSANQALGDALLGGVLAWSYDAALLMLVALTIGILLLVRVLTTHSSLLRDTASDLRTLRQRLRRTPRGDRSTRQRLQATRGRVARLRLWAELPGALLSLLIVSSIVSWGGERLRSLPPVPGEPVFFRAEFPVSHVGESVHIVPNETFLAEPGWVRSIRRASQDRSQRGRAEWLLTFHQPGRYAVVLRTGDKTLQHEMVVGRPIFPARRQMHGEHYETAVFLKVYRPFGFVPPWRWLGLPAWFAAFFVLVLIGLTAGRRLLGVR